MYVLEDEKDNDSDEPVLITRSSLLHGCDQRLQRWGH